MLTLATEFSSTIEHISHKELYSINKCMDYIIKFPFNEITFQCM